MSVCLCVCVKSLDVSHGANHTVHYSHTDSCVLSVFYLFYYYYYYFQSRIIVLLLCKKKKKVFLLYELEDLSPNIYVAPFPIRMYSVHAVHLCLNLQTLIKYV